MPAFSLGSNGELVLDYSWRNARQNYVVYWHTLFDMDVPVYVGLTKLTGLFEFNDAWRREKWRKAIGLIEGAHIRVHLYMITTNKAEAERGRALLIRSWRPTLNDGIIEDNRNRIVYCLETGEYWYNAAETARVIGCAATTLSNHLVGRSGYESIAGRHYKRGIPEELARTTPERLARTIAAQEEIRAKGEAQFFADHRARVAAALRRPG